MTSARATSRLVLAAVGFVAGLVILVEPFRAAGRGRDDAARAPASTAAASIASSKEISAS